VKPNKFYKAEGEKVKREMKFCPRCGDGYIFSHHKDRNYCGNCHLTEWKKNSK